MLFYCIFLSRCTSHTIKFAQSVQLASLAMFAGMCHHLAPAHCHCPTDPVPGQSLTPHPSFSRACSAPGSHELTLHPCGFACSGCVMSMGWHHTRSLVSDFFHSASCPQGSQPCTFLWLHSVPLSSAQSQRDLRVISTLGLLGIMPLWTFTDELAHGRAF